MVAAPCCAQWEGDREQKLPLQNQSDTLNCPVIACEGASIDLRLVPVDGVVLPYRWRYLDADFRGSLPSGLEYSISDDSQGNVLRIFGTIGSGTSRDQWYKCINRQNQSPVVRDRSEPTPLDAQVYLGFWIDEAPLAVEPGSLPPVTVGKRYSATVAASGGHGGYSWGQATGLPGGLSSYDIGNGVLMIEGEADPRYARTAPYEFTVTVSDSEREGFREGYFGYKLKDSEVFSLSVPPVPLAISVADFEPLNAGVELDEPVKLSVSGGAPEYDLAVSGLPAGLEVRNLDQTTWEIYGTPSLTSGSYDPYVITVDVSDGAFEQQLSSMIFSLRVNGAAIKYTTRSFPAAILQSKYEAWVDVEGGLQPLTMAITGLPDGLDLFEDINTARWVIRGVVTDAALAGPHVVAVTVTDSSDPVQEEVMKYALIVIDPDDGPPPPFITTAFLHGADEGSEYAAVTLDAVGGIAPYDWSESSGLPQGLALTNDGADWIISGSPVVGSAGDYAVQLIVRDADNQTDSVILLLTVAGSSGDDSGDLGGDTAGGNLRELAVQAGCSMNRESPPVPVWLLVVALAAAFGAVRGAAHVNEEKV